MESIKLAQIYLRKTLFFIYFFAICGYAPAALAQSESQPALQPAQQASPQSAPNPPALPVGSVGGMGDINLFPKRVVIDGRRKVASVGLYNKSTQPGEYDIIITDKMMTGDGQLVDLAGISDPAAKATVRAASGLLRYSPRKVMLAGSEAQTVRIMARITPDLPPGEYRTHFSAVAVPPGLDKGFTAEQAAGTANPNTIGVRILPRFGISIPVIVRVGQTTLSAGLADLAVTTQPSGGKVLGLTITRSGTRSAFGDITITAPGLRKPLLEVKGIGVYTELTARRLSLPLPADTNPALLRSGARLKVTYTDDDEAPGQILAQQEFIVP